ncbi:DRD2L protein, partial [Atractosteus spatula]|nr:DRD2L protein [Atractosteus spatula]
MESFADNETYYGNETDVANGTERVQRHQYNYYAMLLTLLIFVIVFGNVLVCMAVSREKALQTTTNYLIVSLAVADLLVATLVMPWVVYLEVVGEWRFSKIHCDIFVTLDVMMCTASILNLCAISIDRYTAVAMPMLYNTRYSSKRRVTVMISVVWVLSFAISCPLLFGLNNTATRDDALCVIANPAFVVYSSIVSFYVPFIITLLVYVQIYVVLRKRRKRVNTKRSSHGMEADVHATLKVTLRLVSCPPLRKNLSHSHLHPCNKSLTGLSLPLSQTSHLCFPYFVPLSCSSESNQCTEMPFWCELIVSLLDPSLVKSIPFASVIMFIEQLDKCTHPEDVKLCTVIVKSNGSFPVNKKKVILIQEAVNHPDDMEMDMMTSTSPPEKKKHKPAAPQAHLSMPATSNQCQSMALPSPADSPVKAEKNGHTRELPKAAKAFEIQAMPNGKTRTSVKTLSKRKLSQQKEKKATQMLAIVLDGSPVTFPFKIICMILQTGKVTGGHIDQHKTIQNNTPNRENTTVLLGKQQKGVFIICWLPFFITHILNTHCTKCRVPLEMYNAFTWLGYVNSAVNPIIYTTFNIEFRKAFIKILHC